MFMVLTSILTVSFIRIVNLEQQQTLNDDLSKGAYDAAQAGVEDAKRAIKYCQGSANCDDTSGAYRAQCPGFFDSGAITTALDLNKQDDTIIVGDPNVNQRYTCVTISNETLKVWGELDPASAKSQSVFIPLKSSAGFDRVKISWSLKAAEGAPPTTVPSAWDVSSNNPRYTGSAGTSWQSTWPAMMRAMLVRHPSGSFSASQVQSTSKFIFPVSDGSYGSDVPLAGASRDLVYCNPGNTGAAGNDSPYVCEAFITGIGGGQDWYLQLAPQYQPTNYKVELYSGGTRRMMQDAGFVIDSTGAAGDVYRRVQVIVGPDDIISPNAAIQSGKTLCKNFWVTGYHSAQGVLFGDDC